MYRQWVLAQHFRFITHSVSVLLPSHSSSDLLPPVHSAHCTQHQNTTGKANLKVSKIPNCHNAAFTGHRPSTEIGPQCYLFTLVWMFPLLLVPFFYDGEGVNQTTAATFDNARRNFMYHGGSWGNLFLRVQSAIQMQHQQLFGISQRISINTAVFTCKAVHHYMTPSDTGWTQKTLNYPFTPLCGQSIHVMLLLTVAST